ncbi:hypothetical protein SALBM135S_04062 [Streptomyces alboniger]
MEVVVVAVEGGAPGLRIGAESRVPPLVRRARQLLGPGVAGRRRGDRPARVGGEVVRGTGPRLVDAVDVADAVRGDRVGALQHPDHACAAPGRGLDLPGESRRVGGGAGEEPRTLLVVRDAVDVRRVAARVAPELEHHVIRPLLAHQRGGLVPAGDEGVLAGAFEVVAEGGAGVGRAAVLGPQAVLQLVAQVVLVLHGEGVAEVEDAGGVFPRLLHDPLPGRGRRGRARGPGAGCPGGLRGGLRGVGDRCVGDRRVRDSGRWGAASRARVPAPREQQHTGQRPRAPQLPHTATPAPDSRNGPQASTAAGTAEVIRPPMYRAAGAGPVSR